MKSYNRDLNVYDAAKIRIKEQILNFPDFYVSFSGGKDSGVLINLVLEVAKELKWLPVKCVFSDLEVIFKETERYAKSIMDMPEIEPYWLCVEELDDNASSVYQRYFKIWDESKKDNWVRDMPNMPYVINKNNMPNEFKKYLELDRLEQWSIECFGEYLCDKLGIDSICNFIGMRADESYGRHMAIATQKHRTKKNQYTYCTKNNAHRTWTSLPIYDWETPDIWLYYAVKNLDYNRVYDSMFLAGLKSSEMRTCSAFGEEQKKSLWLWKIVEPETFEKMLQRVEGVNFGANYNHTNINRGKVKKPSNVSWKQYLEILLSELPIDVKLNFEEKFKIVYDYHRREYCKKLGYYFDFIACDSRKESKEKSSKNNIPIKVFFSYETLCGAIIKRDFVFKKYGFGYSNKMSNRIQEIQEKWNQEL